MFINQSEILNNHILQVALPVFEGPLDLLFYLIKQNKIDIYDIPIALITKQYLAYLDIMKELDINIASEFLLMASTLIYIKSKMLLPKPEQQDDEDDPRQELVDQLIEYQQFKEASKALKERYNVWSKAYPRKTSNEEEFSIQELSIFDLLTAIKKIFDKPAPKIYIPQETVRVEEKIEEILNVLNLKKSVVFDELFNPRVTKLEIIVTFLALLELLRLKIVKAYQEKPFGGILINMEDNNESRSYI